MLRKEPALILAVLAAIAQAVVMYVTGNVDADVDWLMPILTVFAGFATRQSVFSEQTVREAGFTPTELTKRAENPAITPAVGE